MQAKIKNLSIHNHSQAQITRPYEITITLHGFVTPTEMRMLQMADIQKLPLSSIGCAKLKGKLKDAFKANPI